MSIVSLACPKCGANLDIDDESNVIYCQYCGAKLLLEGRDKARREMKLRLAEMQHEERMRQSKYEHKERKQKSDRRLKILGMVLNAGEDSLIHALFMFVLFFLLCAVPLSFLSCSESGKYAKLERLEADIQSDIEAGNYDEALLKTKKLVYDGSAENDTTKLWKKKKKEYETIIEEKMRERNASDPSYMNAPKSSDDFKKMKGQEAVDLLKEAGFTNVSMIEVPDDNGVWIFGKKPGRVEHVQFAGKTEFTTEDGCKLNDKIVVYTYEE